LDKPAWIERIVNDTQAYQSFLDYIITEESRLMEQMRDALALNELDKARICAGESSAFKKLRHQILMYEREEEQYAIVQEQESGA
jgi:hypothetical protein